MRIMVLGAGGMLGHAVFRVLAADRAHDVVGTVRVRNPAMTQDAGGRVLDGVEAGQGETLAQCIDEVRPQAVVNCIGVVKQVAGADDPARVMPINASLPHRLAALCAASGARLVHISTDCVFSGARGGYTEADTPDATDLYGRSKLLGELADPRTVTLRTSIIGHELSGKHGLLEWFLSQPGPVSGFRRAIFSGLPTVELASLIRDQVLPNTELQGLYHVASQPINKYELLRLIGAAYGHQIDVDPVDEPAIDRSLDGRRFARATGYRAPPWPELVSRMREFG